MRIRHGISSVRRVLKEHPLLVGFVAAFIPLIILLVQQFLWLTELNAASTMAHRAALRSFLSAVGGGVEHTYRGTAERLLNVPGDHLQADKHHKIAEYWKTRPRKGVRRLFAVDFTVSPTGNFYVYEPQANRMVSSTASDESLAIVLATLPWQRWARDRSTDRAPMLHVNEQDPDHRIVLKPVVDEAAHVIGVVGFVLDDAYVRNKLFDCIIDRKLSSFFAPNVRDKLSVTVVDERGRPVVGEASGHSITAPMPFILKDWRLGISDHAIDRSSWVAGTVWYDMAVGLVLAIVLLCGIALALTSASRAMHLSQMKSDFVSNVSHELRTPLCSIRLFAEFLSLGRAKTPDKVVQYGQYIERESRRLSRLIDNILDFSRIESKRKVYRRKPTDIREVVRSVVSTVDLPLEEGGLRLRTELPDQPGPVMDIDADAIAQALHNLLDNAAKYSKSGGDIVVRLRPECAHVVISVEDHGIGIAKADQAKVFERFHRVGTGLVHDVKGCGLGLSIVDHAARAHGGRVELKSELGHGSTFSLWLPTEVHSDHAEPAGR